MIWRETSSSDVFTNVADRFIQVPAMDTVLIED